MAAALRILQRIKLDHDLAVHQFQSRETVELQTRSDPSARVQGASKEDHLPEHSTESIITGHGNETDTKLPDAWQPRQESDRQQTQRHESEPEESEPEESEPEESEPEVSEPEVSEPEVSEPKKIEPEVSETEVSEQKYLNRRI